MSWSSTFRIADVVVRVESNTTPCDDSIRAIIQPYLEVDTKTPPDILFSVEWQSPRCRLLLDRDGLLWESLDARDIPPALEVHLYRQLLLRLFPEYLSLHASGVNIRQQACLFAGISGAGKSSLCTAALLAGCSYLSDEFSLLDRQGRVHPFPRPLQWDGPEHPAFDIDAMTAAGVFIRATFSFAEPGGNILTSQLWLPSNVQEEPLPLGMIVLPRYDGSGPAAELAPIKRSEALLRLTEHLHQRVSAAEDIRQLNRRIPASCSFYRLQFSDVHAAWERVSAI